MHNTTSTRKNSPRPMVYATPIDRKPDRSALWVGLGALAVILPLMLCSATLILFQVNQLNLPNVFIFDRDVGMISRDGTENLIDETWNQNRTILLTASGDPDIQYQLSPQELGLWVDPQATADAAFDTGRSSDPINDLGFVFSGDSRVIMPVLYYDETQARQTLESIAEELAYSPVEASVALQDGIWIAIPGKDGRAIDIVATLDSLFNDAFSILLSGSVSVHVDTIPPEVLDLSPLLGQIESVVSRSYRLSAYDPITDESIEWSIPLESKTAWVTVDQESQEIKLKIKPADVETLLTAWESELGEGLSFDPSLDITALIESWETEQIPVVSVYNEPTTYQVSQGESLWSISLKLGMPMWYIIDANPGLSVNNIYAGMNLTIPSRNVLLPLPVVPNKRILISIGEQRMTVYEDGQVRNTYIVSTGVSDSPTMAGFFQVQTHELNAYASNWDLYMPHFLGIYEAWPGFMNGIHGLPMLSSGNRLWASTLGSPASYGCIILDLAAAEDLYNWADPGVVVEITR